MKNRDKSRYRRVALVLAGLLILALLVAWRNRNALDAAFRDWFYGTFMTIKEYVGPDGENYNLLRPDWPRMVALMVGGLIAVCASWVLIGYCAARNAWRRQTREITGDLAEMIQEYLNSDRDASDLFREEYGAIGAQIAELKAKTVLQEQKLREERGGGLGGAERRGRGAAGSAARGGWGLGETSLARLPCASAASAAGRKYSSERRGFGRWRAEIWAKPVVRGLTDTI